MCSIIRSEKMSEVIVIQDEKDQYVSNRAFTLTDGGWYYSYFTGVCPNFVCYSQSETAEKEKNFLQDLSNSHSFKKMFHLGHNELKSIKNGEHIIEKIVCQTT
jgi:hypothetical protein